MDVIISANSTILNLMYEAFRLEKSQDGISECGYAKSAFVYSHKKNDGTLLLYNTLYNSLVRLYPSETEQYNSCAVSESDFSHILVENGFFIPDMMNEKRLYLAAAKEYTYNFIRPLSLTITTTLRCNARCPYCYESGVSQHSMEDSTADKIVSFIKARSALKEVKINWFGGEPLLNIPFIRLLTAKLDEDEIKFSSYVITNGSLITSAIADEFIKWKVSDVQISLDGTAEVYEKQKRYITSNGKMLDSVLDNITLLLERNIFVHIRLNICRENCEDILRLVSELDKCFDRFGNVVYYPAFLSGTVNPLSDTEKIAFIVSMFHTVKNPSKLTAGTKFYEMPRIHACMKDDPFSFSIDVNGDIFNCEHYVGRKDKSFGNIAGVVQERQFATCLPQECFDCVFLPKCFGGCASNRECGDSPCMIEKYLICAYMELL